LQEKNDGGKDKDALGWFFKVLLKAGTGRLSASGIGLPWMIQVRFQLLV
jgi:hypothetical protein